MARRDKCLVDGPKGPMILLCCCMLHDDITVIINSAVMMSRGGGGTSRFRRGHAAKDAGKGKETMSPAASQSQQLLRSHVTVRGMWGNLRPGVCPCNHRYTEVCVFMFAWYDKSIRTNHQKHQQKTCECHEKIKDSNGSLWFYSSDVTCKVSVL